MEEFFAAKATSNDQMICIGPLTRQEAAEAVDASLGDGTGLYIYLANASGGGKAVDVLARVASEEAARVLSRLIGFSALAAA